MKSEKFISFPAPSDSPDRVKGRLTKHGVTATGSGQTRREARADARAKIHKQLFEQSEARRLRDPDGLIALGAQLAIQAGLRK